MEGFRFKKFKVYRNAKCLCKFVNDLVKKKIAKSEQALADQINRAGISIVLNIAEGSGNNSDTEFARFLGISIRSVYEVVAGFDIACDFCLITQEENNSIEKLATELAKQLSAFRNKLKQS